MKFVLIFLIIIPVLLTGSEVIQFRDLLDEVKVQSREFQGSELHQQLKANRDLREYEIGDQNTFWSWDLSIMPPLWIQTPSTCRAVGEHCYIFVADDQWNFHMDQQDVDTILPYLEEYTMNTMEYGAIEMDIINFGPIPDELDDDPRIIVFYSELGSYMGTMFDGYFSSYNMVTEEEAQNMNPPGHSNECEMIYMTCHPLNPIDPIRISVLAHELQHMIHWGQDANEMTWVDEGCAELAMVLFGMPDPIVDFPYQPDNSLTVWNQQFADYVKVMLFYTYLWEHYNEGDLILDIVSEPLNSISGIEAQLIANGIDQDFATIFRDWTIANYVDDPAYPEYYYESFMIPAFSHSGYHSIYPCQGAGSINHWAADYIHFGFPDRAAIEIDLNTNNPVDVSIVLYNDFDVLSIFTYTQVTDWSESFIHAGDDFTDLVMILSNSSNYSITYNYEAVLAMSQEEETINLGQYDIGLYPNPVILKNNQLQLNMVVDPLVGDIDFISLYNLKGQRIFKGKPEGTSLVIDLENSSSMISNRGIYIYRINAGGRIYQDKIMIMK